MYSKIDTTRKMFILHIFREIFLHRDEFQKRDKITSFLQPPLKEVSFQMWYFFENKTQKMQGGKGHWTVNYITSSFLELCSSLLNQKLY